MFKRRLLLPVLGFLILAVIGVFLWSTGLDRFEPVFRASSVFQIQIPWDFGIPTVDATLQTTLPEEVRRIDSRDFLLRTVDGLRLDQRWRITRQGAVDRLERSISVSVPKGTDLIQLEIGRPTRGEAGELCTAIGEDFARYHQEREKEALDAYWQVRSKLSGDQGLKVSQLQSELASIPANSVTSEEFKTAIKAFKTDLEEAEALERKLKFELLSIKMKTMLCRSGRVVVFEKASVKEARFWTPISDNFQNWYSGLRSWMRP